MKPGAMTVVGALLLGSVLPTVVLAAPPPKAPGYAYLTDPALRLGSRFFSKAEVLAILELSSAPRAETAAAARAFLLEQRVLLSSIVLCERAGIELSAAATRQDMERHVRSLGSEGRYRFRARAAALELTESEYLSRQSSRLDRQLAVALRSWYLRKYGDVAEVPPSLIEDYYRRHQTDYEFVRVPAPALLVLPAARRAELTALNSRLRQGEPFARVRAEYASKYATAAEPIELLSHNPEIIRCFQRRDASLEFVPGVYKYEHDDVIVLLDGTLKLERHYRPLDADLQGAIRNLLYDGLARGRLDESLRGELNAEIIEFFF